METAVIINILPQTKANVVVASVEDKRKILASCNVVEDTHNLELVSGLQEVWSQVGYKLVVWLIRMGNVNGCHSLGTIFINILWQNDKEINFLTAFYIFHESGVKTFLKWFNNNYPK